jgi:hypothetical protein
MSAASGPLAGDGHLERGRDDLGVQRVAHRPADAAARADVDDRREVQEALLGRDGLPGEEGRGGADPSAQRIG